jgi:hypothetical protein
LAACCRGGAIAVAEPNAGRDKAMAEGQKTGRAAQAERRRERLAAELRSNLKKRKEQARQRAAEGQSDPKTGNEETSAA